MGTDDMIRLNASQTLRVITSAPDVLELESTWEPGTSARKPPTHWHPRQHEHFEVLEGRLTVDVGDERSRVLDEGETLDVPAGTPHCMWNAGAEVARASWRITPALRTEEMFRFMDSGLGPLRTVRMFLTFRDEFRLGRPRRRWRRAGG